MSSTRAEVQNWQVDTSSWKAKIVSTKRRQVYRMASRLNVKPLAAEIADAIINNKESSELKRYPDGRVKVLIGEVIPDIGYKDTVSGRRKRFRKVLEETIAEHGWVPIAPNTYIQKTALVQLNGKRPIPPKEA